MRKTPPSTLSEEGVTRAIERLQELVRARGLKRSAVRDAVARAALRFEGHFTAEDLIGALRDEGHADTHTATIYRVLPLLLEAGLIEATLISSPATKGEGQRYERVFEREHHDHLICTRCRKVVEFHFEAFEVLQEDVAARFGFELTGHVHELLGVCKSCRSRG